MSRRAGARRTRASRWARAAVAVALAWGVLAGAGPAGAGSAPALRAAPHYLERTAPAPGVEYRQFTLATSHGTALGHLLTVDLREPGVSLDLLHPDAVASRARVSAMAAERSAIAAVNGDFFDITETQHPGVDATGAAVGPEVTGGLPLKSAVPQGQRFGPAAPPDTSTEDVVGVGADRIARMGRLALRGTVTAEGRGTRPLRGLNQYAVAVDGIGAYTSDWGGASRVRATCGVDTARSAPCSAETFEVTVQEGRVVRRAVTPGKGPIAPGTFVLVGREAGARALRELRVGDPVSFDYGLRDTHGPRFDFALGGFPIVRDRHRLDGLDPLTGAVRTAAGIGDGGHLLYLLVLDGEMTYRAGLTLSELADAMLALGADDVFNLDGGGSSTLVAREADSGRLTVLNHPSGGTERLVPNGIGVFSRPAPGLRSRPDDRR
ncbi:MULTISPECIES: phosphodiester glycosidase family protein [unclassified Streptomyces]|uniref:phosphodiester glycosidase family protein n=1 Tax=unclassified Streptomyces TaxID=2593676 RepID=UPI00336A6906